VADQDGVRALRVERAVGLVGDLEAVEVDAAVERERACAVETRDEARRIVRSRRAMA
jgi:hypothetical protein